MRDGEAPLCVTCKHCEDVGSLHHSHYGCDHWQVGARKSLVDGKQLYVSCSKERSNPEGECGPAGKLWEAKDDDEH